jgi:putative hydrolase of HD superfamily
MKDLQKILKYTYAFSGIERDIVYPDGEKENDAEHAYQLALSAWYIIEKDKLPLNLERVLKLCLAHDLVEMYSGDVPLWGPTGHTEKDAKEYEAIKRMKAEIPEIPNMTSAIEEYKSRSTEEAKFAAGLDKLLPLLNQIETGGVVWKRREVSFDRAMEVLKNQAEISLYLGKYFEEALKELETYKGKYFDIEK